MVSFWPWKAGEDAASFEKALSTLSTRISKVAAQNDVLRQRSRRVRVMWTLYAGFAYILGALILTLVTGWKSWGAVEMSIVAGGPVVIYLVRYSMTTYYDYRLSNTHAYLEKLNKERDATIERLKAATKYNSTQQLLEKYGSPKQPIKLNQPAPSDNKKGGQASQKPQGPRTNIPPPPTANIQRSGPQPPTAQRPSSSPQPGPQRAIARAPADPPTSEEFAPNAYDAATLTKQYATSTASTFTQSHWYDRILDALLGEDETQPKNRLALICADCRLVNGQAPPGTRSLNDVGRWRCGGCGSMNGKEKREEDVVRGLVEGWESERAAAKTAERGNVNPLDGDRDASDEGEDIDADNRETDIAEEGEGRDVVMGGAEEVLPPAKNTRSRVKGKGRK